MNNFGSLILLTDAETPYTTAGTSDGFFSISGTTCSLTLKNIYMESPRANNGYGGAFYLTNTQTK
jgi:hypothetical protein